MNTIIIELCAEDRARLDRIYDALTHRGGEDCKTCAAAVTQAIPTATAQNAPTEAEDETPKTTPEEKETPAPADPVAEGLPWGDPEAQQHTLAEVKKKVVTLAAIKELKPAVRDIVKSYADHVDKLPLDRLDEIWTKLTALEK